MLVGYIVAIILARGGSKGIPKKNLLDFCGKPLVAWSIEHAKNTRSVSSVWVSSDDLKILNVAKQYDAQVIKRPKNLSTDSASAELGYLHAIEHIEKEHKIDLVVALQATSPIRESRDLELAIKKFYEGKYDSMFSASPLGDFLIWKKKDNTYRSLNYNYKNRPRRQKFEEQFVENGSFYIFKPKLLKKNKNRLGGKIGISLMEFWKSFELDEKDDIEFCKLIMKHYILKKRRWI